MISDCKMISLSFFTLLFSSTLLYQVESLLRSLNKVLNKVFRPIFDKWLNKNVKILHKMTYYADHDVTFKEGYALSRLYNVSSILRPEKYSNLLKIPVAGERFIEYIHCCNLLEGHIWGNKHKQCYYTTCSVEAWEKTNTIYMFP